MSGVITVKLPAKHAHDWWDRCGDEFAGRGDGTRIIAHTERTIAFALSPAALRDLIEDSEHYVECMGPDDTGDIDYRPAARTCLRALDRQGLLA